MKFGRHFRSDDLRTLGLPAAWWTDKQGMVEFLFVLFGGIQGNPDLIDHALLADQIGKQRRGGVGDFVDLFVHGRPLGSLLSASSTRATALSIVKLGCKKNTGPSIRGWPDATR